MKPRILVPPGIGDGYWVLCKLRGFLDSRGHARAQIWVHDGVPRRSGEMWARVPFVDFGGYAAVPRTHGRHVLPADRAAIKRAYRQAGYAVQSRVCGFDYFISFNGSLDRGHSLDQALKAPTNWYEPAYAAAVTGGHAAAYRARFGDYVVASFWEHGSYGKFIAEFGEASIVATLRALADAGKTVVVMGAAWDKGAIGERLAAADPRFVSLVGETTYDQLTGLLSGADAVVGHPAGNTLLGPYFRRPTVLLWNAHFHRSMWTNSVAPSAAYRALDTATATPASVAGEVLGLIAARAA